MPASDVLTRILGALQVHAWALMGSLSSAILGHWLGRLHERKSKKEAARLALVSCVSAWIFKVETSDDMIRLRKDSFPEIENALFDYVAHVEDKSRKYAEGALREYRDLDDRHLYACDIVDYEQKLNQEKSAAAKKLVSNALLKIIANAR